MNPERIPGCLLWPLTFPYGAITRMRARLYGAGILRPRRLDGAVISVGNLTVGGTGKTPMVLWIAQRLVAEGKACGILTRGYRGQHAQAGHTSDEAQLLRAHLGDSVAIRVGADRFAGGRELQRRGIRWFVLDDGFQHMQLARDVDIVLIDATNPFSEQLLPAGRRREPRSALRRADLVVITRSSHAPAVEAAVRSDADVPIFYARTDLHSIREVAAAGPPRGDTSMDLAVARTRKLFAFCGIGNPAGFLADLARWQLQVVGHKIFRDHHRYPQNEWDDLVEEARAAGADALVCTEKDTFNLSGVRTDAMNLLYCVISLYLERSDDFWHAILQGANRRHPTDERAHS